MCGKGFTLSSNLQAHQRVHTGEKPYKCEERGKNFRGTPIIKFIWSSTQEKNPINVKCVGRAFSQSSYLQIHQKAHSVEKPHKCEECGQGFNQSSRFQIHQLIHTGEKPYKCEECEGFSRRADLLKFTAESTLERNRTIVRSVESLQAGLKSPGPSESPQWRKAIQMWRMWQELRSEFTPSSPPKSPHWREAIQMWGVWEGLQVEPEPDMHQRVHTGEKPYKCGEWEALQSGLKSSASSECPHWREAPTDVTCVVKSSVGLHSFSLIRESTQGRNPYKCEMCGKSFSWRSNLTIHQRIHVADKAHKSHRGGKTSEIQLREKFYKVIFLKLKCHVNSSGCQVQKKKKNHLFH